MRSRTGVRLATGFTVVLAAALRLPGLLASLPLTQPDEPTVMSRAQLVLEGTFVPPAFDWPLGSSIVAAAGIRLGEALGVVDRAGSVADVYGWTRILFVVVALGVVAVTGLLGAAVGRRAAPVAAWVAGAVVATGFVMVRSARMIVPDQLQVLFVLLALLAVVAAGQRDRLRDRLLLWSAAALSAGAAGGMKYLGITVVVVPMLAVMLEEGLDWPRRLLAAEGLLLLSLVAFVVSTGGSVISRDFVDGFLWQVDHQASGHLGYDHGGPTWWHHLTVTLPGSNGWLVTGLLVTGVGWGAWRGARATKVVTAYAVGLFVVIGLSRIVFPHYVIVVVPVLAALTGGMAADIADWTWRRWQGRERRLDTAAAVLALVLVAAVVPSAADGLRLLRAGHAPDTRGAFPEMLHEALAVEGLVDAPIWTESYTGISAAAAEATGGRLVFGFGTTPEILECRCVAVISTYMEQRYTVDPVTAPVYTAMRARGRLLLDHQPGIPLTYRWDLLPSWGIGGVPLRGPVPALGPGMTVLDLTEPRGAEVDPDA